MAGGSRGELGGGSAGDGGEAMRERRRPAGGRWRGRGEGRGGEDKSRRPGRRMVGRVGGRFDRAAVVLGRRQRMRGRRHVGWGMTNGNGTPAAAGGREEDE
jgi:hypothetical protein